MDMIKWNYLHLHLELKKQKQAKTNSKEEGQSDLCSVYTSRRTSKHQTGNSSVTL